MRYYGDAALGDITNEGFYACAYEKNENQMGYAHDYSKLNPEVQRNTKVTSTLAASIQIS